MGSNDTRESNNVKDVSISNVPLVGKRDRIKVSKRTPDGLEQTEYSNDYLWTADDLFQEKLEKWLYIRSNHLEECLMTFVLSRLAIATTAVLLEVPWLVAFGYVGAVGILVFWLAIVTVIVRSKGQMVPAASLRLFILLIGFFS